MLRGALVELRALHRVPGPWLPIALGVWILFIWLQEPVFLRRSGVPFFWDSIGAALSTCLAMVPLAWILSRSPGAAESVRRAARSPFRMISISSLSIVIYGSETALLAGLAGGGLDLLGGTPDPVSAVETALSGLCILAPLAVLAPGLANLSLSAQGYTVSWLLIAISYAFLFDPGSAIGVVPVSWVQTLISTALATVAGLLLSTVVVHRRIHL